VHILKNNSVTTAVFYYTNIMFSQFATCFGLRGNHKAKIMQYTEGR